MSEWRVISITWDPDSEAEPTVALGDAVSVMEAHHVLQSAADAVEFICPVARVSRGGESLLDVVEVFGEDDE